MRKLPADLSFPPQARERGEQQDITSNKYAFITMTPMFGGGEETKKVDDLRPVRAPSVRGALREWWRVLNRYGKNGTRLSDEELYRRECLIWGGVAFKKTPNASEQQALPSAVRVDVGEWSKPQMIEIAEIPPGKKQPAMKIIPELESLALPKAEKEYPQYAVWPFQGEALKDGVQNVKADKGANRGLLFSVTVAYDSARINYNRELSGDNGLTQEYVHHQVEGALKAWANFGGVGSRPHRGLGALWCEDLAFADENDLKRFVDSVPVIRACLLGEPIVDVGTCNDEQKIVRRELRAWLKAVAPLKEFRQGKNVGRNEGRDLAQRGKLGRSRWPEPSEIREVTGRGDSLHIDRIAETKGVDGFPRANFGMPIIFQFGGNRQEPPTMMLLPRVKSGDEKPANRMSSPLILRPTRFKNGETRPLMLFLSASKYDELVLQETGGSRSYGKEAGMRKADAGSPIVMHKESPLFGFRPDQALEAFENYLCGRYGTSENDRFHRVKTFSVEGGGA